MPTDVPDCIEKRTEGQICSRHDGKQSGWIDCWNMRDRLGRLMWQDRHA